MRNEQLAELIYRTSEGQHGAFTYLYNQTKGQLFAAAFKIVDRKELADEIVQEAYVQIWLNAAQFESGKGKAITWMISITRYRALDCLRYQNRRKEERLTEFNLPQITDPCPSIKQDHQQLRQIIDKLQIKQCDSIKLAYYSELSHLEITSYMDKPLGTVKSWIRRSLVELRKTITV